MKIPNLVYETISWTQIQVDSSKIAVHFLWIRCNRKKSTIFFWKKSWSIHTKIEKGRQAFRLDSGSITHGLNVKVKHC